MRQSRNWATTIAIAYRFVSTGLPTPALVPLAMSWYCWLTPPLPFINALRAQAEVALIEVPDPDLAQRRDFIDHQLSDQGWFHKIEPSENEQTTQQQALAQLAQNSAGLSLLALRQLLRGSNYHQRLPNTDEVTTAVQQHITARLGDDVVDFVRPHHRLDAVIGFRDIKQFLKNMSYHASVLAARSP